MLLITFDSFKKNTFDTFWTPMCYGRTLLDGNWTLGVLEVFQKCSKLYQILSYLHLWQLFQNGGTHSIIKQKHSKKVRFLFISVSTQWLGYGSTWIICWCKWPMSVELNKVVLIIKFYDNKKSWEAEHFWNMFKGRLLISPWNMHELWKKCIFSIVMLYE